MNIQISINEAFGRDGAISLSVEDSEYKFKCRNNGFWGNNLKSFTLSIPVGMALAIRDRIIFASSNSGEQEDHGWLDGYKISIVIKEDDGSIEFERCCYQDQSLDDFVMGLPMNIKSAQQGDAPEPATKVDSALPQFNPPAQ